MNVWHSINCLCLVILFMIKIFLSAYMDLNNKHDG